MLSRLLAYILSCTNRKSLGLLSTLLCFCSMNVSMHAQDCPPNIDFETGTFGRWICYAGTVAAVGTENVISLTETGGPMPNQHTIYPSVPNAGLDPYGGFPINCPNGSGYSIRLGNDEGGGQAEGISYEFTIPAGQQVYNLIYHYAVVFQDPNHRENEQPTMVTEIMNMTDNVLIDCSSFSFYPYGSLLPGFQLSPEPGSQTPVWYKDWSAVSINLNNMGGKTIRLFFKTSDCTFRRHFGYAYIDVNSECSSEFTGATYCPDDSFINVVAPYGYQSYTWFNSSFTQTLGNSQTLVFSPPPPSGTKVAVELIPYNGYGCLDTLYANLLDTLTIQARAGPDKFSCNQEPVQIGANPRPGLTYQWSPSTGLSDPLIANPLASPSTTTAYVVTTRNAGGGCMNTDTVIVTASTIDNRMSLQGKDAYCIDSGDSTILHVQPATSIQWYRNGALITGATGTSYRVTRSGSYHAVLSNTLGCSLATAAQDVLIDVPAPAERYPLQYAIIDKPVDLKARTLGTTAAWSPAFQLDNAATYTPVFTGSSDQLYLITLTAQSGCVTVDTQEVKTIRKVEVFVPTGFTPDNNGLNDYLRPILVGVKELKYFQVFNRWGQLVYSSSSPQPGWDGKVKGVLQPSQVVVWVMEGLGLDGQVYRQKGTCVLIR